MNITYTHNMYTYNMPIIYYWIYIRYDILYYIILCIYYIYYYNVRR